MLPKEKAILVTKLGVPKRVPFILLLPNWVPFFFLPNWVPPILWQSWLRGLVIWAQTSQNKVFLHRAGQGWACIPGNLDNARKKTFLLCPLINPKRSSISDMDSIPLQLLVHTSLANAIPVIDNGLGEMVLLPEAKITDFAVLNRSNLGSLPPDFTICSSLATAAFLSTLSPFQLLYQNKKPWINIVFISQKDSTQHRIIVYVSFMLHLYALKVPDRVCMIHKCGF